MTPESLLPPKAERILTGEILPVQDGSVRNESEGVSLEGREWQDRLDSSLDLFTERWVLEDLPQGASRGRGPEREHIDEARLKAEYNIDYPGRYPVGILKDMLSGGDSGMWGIVVVAKHDHNGAFEYTPELESLQEDLGGEVGIRIVEAASASEAAELMDKLGAKRGKSSFGVCIAHGSEEGFTLEDKEDGHVSEGEQVGHEDGEGTSLDLFAQAFARNSHPEASLVMASCSTGKGENPIAKKMAVRMKRKVIAPDADTGIESLGATQGSPVSFEPVFSGANAKHFDGS